MARVERLPPSPLRVFALSASVFAAYGGYRWFFAHLLPGASIANAEPRAAAVAAGSLPCALFFYWLARLRHRGPTVGNRPGAAAPALLLLAGLASAAAVRRWMVPPPPWDPDLAVPMAAGVAAALASAACGELALRGSLFLAAQELGGRRGDLLALAVGALGFAALHACFQGPWELPLALAEGLALGVARLRGASLGFLILGHALPGAAEALWLGAPASVPGHTPELGAAGVAVLASLFLWFLPGGQKRGLPPPPPAG